MAKRRTPVRSNKLKNRKPILNKVNHKKYNKRKIRTIKSTRTNLPSISTNHPSWGGSDGGSLLGGGSTSGTMEMNQGISGDDIDAGGEWELLGIIAYGSQQECHCTQSPCYGNIVEQLGYYPLFIRQENMDCYADMIEGSYPDMTITETYVGPCCWTETQSLPGGGPFTNELIGSCGTGMISASQSSVDDCVAGDYPAGLTEYECRHGGWADGGTNPDGTTYDEWWFGGLNQTGQSMANCGPNCTSGLNGISNFGWMNPAECCSHLSGNGAGWTFEGVDSFVEVCPLQNGASNMNGGAYLPMKCWKWAAGYDTAGGEGRGGG